MMVTGDPNEATRMVLESEGLNRNTEGELKTGRYSEGYSYRRESSPQGLDRDMLIGPAKCDLAPIQSVLRRIPAGGEACRKRVIDFHCRDVPGNVRLRMHRSTAMPQDGGGKCPHNIHHPTSGLIRSTFNGLSPPKIRGGQGAGKGGAAVGWIIFATPDHVTIRQLKGLLEATNTQPVHPNARTPERPLLLVSPAVWNRGCMHAEIPQFPNFRCLFSIRFKRQGCMPRLACLC